MPMQGQAPYNRLNEIIVKLQDEAANKVLERKTPAEMTGLVNEYIKSIDTRGNPKKNPPQSERRGDWKIFR